MCRFNGSLWTCLALLSVLVGSGCQRSQLAKRKRAAAGAYAALSAEDKASVDRGTLHEGMTTNAVLIAWGQPSIVSTISTPNGPFLFWEYYRQKTVVQEPQAIVSGAPTPVPQSRVLPNIPPTSRVVEWLARTAVFHDDRLVNWEPRSQPR